MQIIKYKWEKWKPVFILDNLRRINLIGNKISIKLGKKYCIGYWIGGKHYSCPKKLQTDELFCDECRKKDDYFSCIKCSGSVCFNKSKRQECMQNEYYVYLAAFDSFLKVGISYKYRLLERLVEQGADFGVRVMLVKDGKDVRRLEQKIKSILNITDRVNGYQKSRLIFSDPNKSVKSIIKAIEKLNQNNIKVEEPIIYDLRHYYRLENVLKPPKLMAVEQGLKLQGKVVAAKGNIIILENEDKFFAINSHKMLGYEVKEISNSF